MTTDGAASATARRAYAVAHGWEHASALSAGQSAALGTVAQAVIGTKWRRDLARARVDALSASSMVSTRRGRGMTTAEGRGMPRGTRDANAGRGE